MQDVVSTGPTAGQDGGRRVLLRLLSYLPRGNTLDDRAWRRRHRLLERVLLLHVPLVVGLGLLLGHSAVQATEAVVAPLICLVLGHLVTHRRWASFFVTGGLVFCSIALVLLTSGSIEAHFHFFIIIGFIALYQDWVPFLWNVAFTTISHGVGTIWLGGQIFNHPAAQAHPWLWSFVHGVAVLFACFGMVIFWRVTEDEQTKKEELGRQLITADAEIGRRKFTSEMLVNLARRNQSMLYRQLDIINELENREQDPDALADLFKLDHLATRVRRNAESLLVLAGQQAPRTWSEPVPLRDVIRAAIAETEDLDRVVFAVDDRIAVSGTAIADLTHLLAELTENAVRFSPPATAVTIRVRPNRRDEGGHLLTVEDWGVGMPADDLAAANQLLAHPGDLDLAVAQRLGFHVVARLATRHGIAVSLTATPGSGITAVVVLPATLFTQTVPPGAVAPLPGATAFEARRTNAAGRLGPSVIEVQDYSGRRQAGPNAGTPSNVASMPPGPASPQDAGPTGPDGRWRGWWSPETQAAADGPGGFGSTGREVRSNGPDEGAKAVVNGASAHRGGSGTNAPGAGDADTDGSAADGTGVAGPGADVADRTVDAVDGPAGTESAGSEHPGTDGAGDQHRSNGHGSNGHGSNGHPAPARPEVPAVNQDADPDRPAAPPEQARALPVATSDSSSPAIGIPVARAADGDRSGPDASTPHLVPGGRPVPDHGDRSGHDPSTPHFVRGPHPAPDQAAGMPRLHTSPVPTARKGAPPPVIDRRRPERPPIGPAVVAALPVPRTREAVLPSASAPPRLPGSRELRRRVPQAHLAPELRHPSTGLAETAAPLSADAAASALSRYQASRLAAQAVVGDSEANHQGREGERE